MPAPPVRIRNLEEGEELALRALFHDSVHELARGHYTAAQLEAWAPADFDEREWIARIRRLRPFVAEIGGERAGYADLQDDGLIDHFFVAPAWAGCGVGRALLQHIEQSAAARGIPELRAEVSLAARAFFSRAGFVELAAKEVTARGVTLTNSSMRKQLVAS